MQKRVRMVDIAEKMGVSTFTVSKALSGKDGVSEELRAEVRRVAEQMGYRLRIKIPNFMLLETVSCRDIFFA